MRGMIVAALAAAVTACTAPHLHGRRPHEVQRLPQEVSGSRQGRWMRIEEPWQELQLPFATVDPIDV